MRRLDEHFTAQAFITTDIDDNQITAFHPGAMSQSHLNRIAETDGVRLAIVSPDGRQGMVEHARDLARAKIPYVLDPGRACRCSRARTCSRCSRGRGASP